MRRSPLDAAHRALGAKLTPFGGGGMPLAYPARPIAQYTHLLDPDDASVLDDIIVWWVGDERFDVMPNASNTERVRSALGVGEDADVTGDRAILAVQGPEARSRLGSVFPE